MIKAYKCEIYTNSVCELVIQKVAEVLTVLIKYLLWAPVGLI